MASRLPAKRLLSVLALLLSVLICVPAVAQNGTERQTAAKVLRLVKDANDEFDRGEFNDALQLYQEAYDLYPDAVLLYRIGLSADKSGNSRRAIDAYGAFVAAAKSDDATATKVSERIAELQAELPPRLTITTRPAGADVFIGDLESASLGQTPGDFDLPTGEVQLLIRLPGYEVVAHTVTMANAELGNADFELSEIEGVVDVNPPPDKRTERGMGLGTWGLITTGVGVAVLGTGAAFAALSASATSDVNDYDKRAPGSSRTELEELKTKANKRHSASVAMFAAGGVITAVGVTLIIVDMMSDDKESAALAPSLGIGQHGAWVGFTGRF